MITYVKGNIVEDDADALVNATNCVGVMGAGVAKAFRDAFDDDYFKNYKYRCDQGEEQVGKVALYWYYGDTILVNFPTMHNPGNDADIEGIRKGLNDLAVKVYRYHIESIAIPALGCGIGGFNFSALKEEIKHYIGYIDCDIRVYEPFADSFAGVETLRAQVKLGDVTKAPPIKTMEQQYEAEKRGNPYASTWRAS